jgi:hypothetical protein
MTKTGIASVSMMQREDHERSLVTVPYWRPHLLLRSKKLNCTQLDSSNRSFTHNHPSGDPTPSNADIQMTKQIVEIAGSRGISVHDYIIVGKNGHASLKGMRLI